jgi:hypothetical protein
MLETSQAADCRAERPSSIGARLRRFVGFQPVETDPLEPAALEAVLAFRGLTSFVGLPTSTYFPEQRPPETLQTASPRITPDCRYQQVAALNCSAEAAVMVRSPALVGSDPALSNVTGRAASAEVPASAGDCHASPWLVVTSENPLMPNGSGRVPWPWRTPSGWSATAPGRRS